MAKDKEDLGYKIIDYPTQTEPVIQTPEGQPMSDRQALVKILNEIIELRTIIGK